MKYEYSFGSVCSGIEAAQLAFSPFGFKQLWCSEIADFPKKVLEFHYPSVPNIGDMTLLPRLITEDVQEAPDIFCGGTPCQAFSLAGWKNGLYDERGRLTMTFIDIANAIDTVRLNDKKSRSIILWENVEGVLNDKTNAFGNFIAGLAGYNKEIKIKKWSKAGFVLGSSRNVAWRVIDAKYFGLPQQRRRLYVLAGGKDFRPDQLLFEFDEKRVTDNLKKPVLRNQDEIVTLFDELYSHDAEKDNKVIFKGTIKFEFFRRYTDCLYSAYGTKWNGNAAAYNGSLFVAQNDRIRRFTPLECERLMGFPDNYTLVEGNSDTNRYQAIGNSWAVPVVKWLASQISKFLSNEISYVDWTRYVKETSNELGCKIYLLGKEYQLDQELFVNTSSIPNTYIEGDIGDIVQVESVPEKFYLTPMACRGILRRKFEHDIKMNSELQRLLTVIGRGESQIA